MTFPASILDTRVELLLAGVWTDVSSYVYSRDPVQITRGRPDEANALNPTVCQLTLDNRSGRFSPRNPLGAYYGQLTRNTQMRVSVPEGGTYLRMETDGVSYASCPDATALHITGDLEIQVDMWPSDMGNTLVASKWSNSVGKSWDLKVLDDHTVRLVWAPTSSTLVFATSTLPLPVGRIAVKVTLAIASGTVTFYTAPTIAGTWTQLGSPSVVGATTLFSTTAALAIGANADLADSGGFNLTPLQGINGKIYAVKLLNGIGGTVVASPTFTAQAAGTTSFTDAQANTWTLSGTAEISDRKYRAHTEVPAWPPRWEPSGADVYAPIQGSGRWRRLTAGSPPPYSAAYRAYARLTGPTAPVAYWPCEDGSSSTVLASGLPGGSPMYFSGGPQLAADSSFLCSQPLPTLGGSGWVGSVQAYTAPAGAANTLRFLLKVPSSSPPADGTTIASLYTYGTVARCDLLYRTGGGLQLKGYNGGGTNLFDTGVIAFNILDQPLRASVELQTSGSNVQYSIVTLVPGATFGLSGSGTVAGSVGNAYQVVIAPSGGMGSAVIGHVSVQPAWDSLFNIGAAINAWIGEKAGVRFARLCAEEGIACRVYGAPGDTVAMGQQTAQAVAALLQECEDADKGLIFEPRQAFGLAYRTRVSMFNQAPAVTLNYAGAQLAPPLEPTDDDRLIANDVTVTRANRGSSVRQALTSGALSTQTPPLGVGPYPQTPTVNLATDGQLGDVAGWLVHLGTVDDLRYPVLSVNLASPHVAGVYYQAQDADIGDRITVTGTPGWLPPDGISQIMEGQTETCYGFIFTESWTCAPEAPYRVGVLDDPLLGRVDTDGSTLHAGISSTATSMQVDTTDPTKPLWTTNAADFPLDVVMGGERITVGSITGTTSPQTFSSLTRSVNGVVKAQTAGADVRLWQPAILSH
ncbi:MAG: hypothetical protein HOW97_32925 [Catenulispora sp.]|nr:hypothetical protein [Catenulispora sp.]